MSDLNKNLGMAADADSLIHDDELAAGSAAHQGAAAIINKNQTLARLNKDKSVMWYLDNSGSMHSWIREDATKDVEWNDQGERVGGNYRHVIMREAVKSMVRQRLNESPNAKLNVFRFSEHPSPIFSSNSAREIEDTLDRSIDASGGSTNICNCFEHALNWVKNHPNDVGLYHMLIVTDAEDHISESSAQEYEERLRKAGIVFEVTLIGQYQEPTPEEQEAMDKAAREREAQLQKAAAGSQVSFTIGEDGIDFDDEDEDGEDVGDSFDGFDEEEFFIPQNAGHCAHVLRRIAARTGGTFRAVSSAKAMTLQIAASSQRLCLPPASI